MIVMLWTVLKRWDQRLFFPYFWLFFLSVMKLQNAPASDRKQKQKRTRREKKKEKEKNGAGMHQTTVLVISIVHLTQKADCATAAHDTYKFTITFNKSLCIHIRLKCPAPLILWNKGLKPFLLYFTLNNRKQRTPTRFLHRLFLEEKAGNGKKNTEQYNFYQS